MGKPIGSHAAGFAYSSALKDKGGNWTWEAMDEWLTSPRGFANGTKMSFAGLGKPEDRANVMEFMASYGGAPAKPEPVAPEAEDAGEDAPGAGQGPVEGAEAGAAESATGMSADRPFRLPLLRPTPMRQRSTNSIAGCCGRSNGPRFGGAFSR